MKKKILLSILAAIFCLLSANAQGKYPNGYFQSSEDYENITAEATIFSKKAKGRAKEEYASLLCNGELSIQCDNGYSEYYALTYTGMKQTAGYVFKVNLQDSDFLQTEGKVLIKRTADGIIFKAISSELKKRTINNFKMKQFPTNVDIP